MVSTKAAFNPIVDEEPAPRTLAHLVHDGRAISVTCRRCHHSETLYMATLIERLGSGFLVKDLAPRLRCNRVPSSGDGHGVGERTLRAVARPIDWPRLKRV